MDFVIAFVRRVVGQHVEDEALFDGLLHAVKVKRFEATVRLVLSELLKRGRLGRSRERQIRRVAAHLAGLHRCEDAVLRIVLVRVNIARAHRAVHVVMRLAALAAVRLVDDHGEPFVAQVRYTVDDEGELLDRRDNDLLAVFQRRFQVGRAQRRGHDVLDLGEILYVFAQLLVEQPAVRDHDDAVEHRLVQAARPRQAGAFGIGFDQLIGRPGDRIRFPRARRMLNQIAVADALGGRMIQQAAYHVQLMIAREDQRFFGQRVSRLTLQQHEMLDDACKAGRLEHLFPQIGGLVAIRVWRITLAVVVALVERQEKGSGPGQFGGHEHLVGVHRHMHQRAAKVQKWLASVAVVTVLLLAVKACGLAGPGVLQLHRNKGHSVQEYHHVDLFQRIGLRIANLAGDAPDIGGEVFVHAVRRASQRGGIHQRQMRIVNVEAFF